LLFAPAAVPAAAQQPAADTAKKKEAALPLEPDRRLRYTAREGTWMSVSVSPDGQTLAFDLLGDLYTLPITGGRATRITSGTAFDTQPVFSPDGERILF